VTAATAIARLEGARRAPRILLDQYRDDGPLALALGAALGRVLRVPPAALVLAGLLPALALVVADGAAASDGAAIAAVFWFVLLAGAASGRAHTDRFAWASPPLVRLGEYGGLLWLAAVAGESARPAAFALLAVLTFRHYDNVYRTRYQGVTIPAWLRIAAGGWDGRLALGCVLLAAGTLTEGYYVAAAVLAVVLVSDSIRSWVAFASRGPVSVYEDEEGEGD
jgi:hypothetical protein